MGGSEASLESTGSWWPLAQNNLHTTKAYLGVAHSEPLHYHYHYEYHAPVSGEEPQTLVAPPSSPQH